MVIVVENRSVTNLKINNLIIIYLQKSTLRTGLQ